MSQLNRTFRYILRLPAYAYPEDAVEAVNKTEARKLIAQAYRADTPRDASRSGFVPFHQCRIEWIEDEQVLNLPDEAQSHVGSDTLAECTLRVDPPHPAIGELCREGKTIHYAFLNGDSESGYVEGSYSEVLEKLNASRK